MKRLEIGMQMKSKIRNFLRKFPLIEKFVIRAYKYYQSSKSQLIEKPQFKENQQSLIHSDQVIPSNIMILNHNVISISDWTKLKRELMNLQSQNTPSLQFSHHSEVSLECTDKNYENKLGVISSIYRPGTMFESFLTNLKEQTIFGSCQVILILVDPLSAELDMALKFERDNQNVLLELEKTRISIYEAWNRGVSHSTTEYLTNMNVDDLRSPNSLQTQVDFMITHPWVDIGYQDIYFMLDRDLDWKSIESIGDKTELGPVTLTELSYFGINAPHNGPIWKRSLHQNFGQFDSTLKSAGDYEFWMRVAAGGAIFSKMKEMSVGYYFNPDGMSTSARSPSTEEEEKLQKKYQSIIELRSSKFLSLSLPSKFENMPWEGADSFTNDVLQKLREIGKNV